MDTATRVQSSTWLLIVYISLSANTRGKGMYPTIPPRAIGK